MSESAKNQDNCGARRIAILGTVGVPGNYGGFETLVDNLVAYHEQTEQPSEVTVYCSAPSFSDRSLRFRGARRRFIPLSANGISSIPYDIWSIFDAALRGHDRLLILGVSGAVALPLLRMISGVRIVTNIDGIEWKRPKWNRLARMFLRWSESIAVRFSHTVIADNEAIAGYVRQRYHRECEVIAYGGDHALEAEPDKSAAVGLPDRYALALCRIEPENNVAMILEAFADVETPLVFLGNWDRSDYGRQLKARYRGHPTIKIHDPVYEPGGLRAIRDRAMLYIHGHSAGGTNPSLVEMMHFGIPILAFDCPFNRHTTEDRALYFRSATELSIAINNNIKNLTMDMGSVMQNIARSRYTWENIARLYFNAAK